MKLTQLAAKPQLVKIQLQDDDIIKEYGEPIEFYIWDRQPMSNFIKFANVKEDDISSLMTSIKDLILDEHGKPVLNDEVSLPINVLTKVIGRVVETLGK